MSYSIFADSKTSKLVDKVQDLIQLLEKEESAIITNADSTNQRKSWAIDPEKQKEAFRNYDDNPRKEAVEKFYKEQHENTTFEFVMKQREKWLKFDKCTMTMLSIYSMLISQLLQIDLNICVVGLVQLGDATISRYDCR